MAGVRPSASAGVAPGHAHVQDSSGRGLVSLWGVEGLRAATPQAEQAYSLLRESGNGQGSPVSQDGRQPGHFVGER